MTFALIGIGIVAPFGLLVALVLSMESSRQRQMQEIRKISRDFDTYLDEITKRNEEIRKRHGLPVSSACVDDGDHRCCSDDRLTCTKR